MADGYNPIKVDQFGGLNTLIDANDLPPFMSPDCSDVEFYPGMVKTRPGFSIPLVGLTPLAFINYLKTYITENTTDSVRTLLIDSLGNFQREDVSTAQGTLTNVYSGLLPNLYPNSVTHFGREYIAMGDGKYGADLPRQFDDTNFDRVSQCGPGEAPHVTDENVSVPISSSAQFGLTSIVTASESGNIITFTTATPHLLILGTNVVITSVTDPDYNGNYPVLAVLSSTAFTVLSPNSGLSPSSGGFCEDTRVGIVTTTAYPFGLGDYVTISGAGAGYDGTFQIIELVNPTEFRYVAAVAGLATTFGGAAASAGNITAGVHQITVIFETRQGYRTKPASPRSWNASGGFRAIVTNIATGPSYVKRRILLFTAAGGDSFFFQTPGTIIPNGSFIIEDNSTTNVTVDFSEASLLSGTNADYLFDLIELGECSNVTSYSSRLVWTGEQNNLQNFNNITFDGGFSPLNDGVHGNINLPLGWTPHPTQFAGGGIAPQSVWGQAYRILGDGSTPRGQILQTAYQDYLGNPILSPNTKYKITVRAKSFLGNPASIGNLVIGFFSATPLGGLVYALQASIRIDISQSSFTKLSVVCDVMPGTIPSDITLRVYGDNFSLGDQVWIDCIEISPATNPVNTSLARVSRVEDPETYSGLDGFLQPADGVGQSMNSAFVLRDFLYLVKDKSLFVTADDSGAEPANWSIRQVSSEIGSPSPRGVGIGDQWAVIAAETGLWYFNGGTFTDTSKLSQEIQPIWDAIDWTRGYLLDVKVDIKRKRIYVNVPMTGGMKLLTLDYIEGFMDPMQNNGVGRKWCPWAVQANSMTLALRNDSTYQLFLGSGPPRVAAVYQLDAGQTHDSAIAIAQDNTPIGVTLAINSYWQSGYFKGEGRLNFGFIEASIDGSGVCSMIARRGDQAWVTNIRGWTLGINQFHNKERNINVTSNRMALRFTCNVLDSWFSLQGFSLGTKSAVWSPTRGINVT